MKEEKEVWKPIEGYEGLYQVSNMGRVKSLERKVWNCKGRGYYMTIHERIKKTSKDSWGYLRVALYKDGKVKNHLIHRLVGQAFLENPMGYDEINHKDENKQNNCVDNLEWCSHSYNNTYNDKAKKAGKKAAEKLRGRKQTEEQIKKKSKPVFSVDRDSGLIMWWQSANEAGRVLGINRSHIADCCKGKAKSCGNHYWFYADDNE